MKKAIKWLTALITLAVLAGGLYYFWKNKIKKDDDDFDDLDDFDDFDDLDDFDEEDTEKEEGTDEERGYVTLNLQKEEQEEEEKEEQAEE
jgi:hypothetical protein